MLNQHSVSKIVLTFHCSAVHCWNRFFTVGIDSPSEPTIFANSRPSASNFKTFSQSLEQSLLTESQNNFGNKIQFLSQCLFLSVILPSHSGIGQILHTKVCWLLLVLNKNMVRRRGPILSEVERKPRDFNLFCVIFYLQLFALKKNTDLLVKEMNDDMKEIKKKEERQTRRRITKMSLFLVGVFLICNSADCVWWLLRKWNKVVYMSSQIFQLTVGSRDLFLAEKKVLLLQDDHNFE